MQAILLESTALLVLWLLLSVWQRDATALGRRPFMGLCSAILLWCVAGLAEVHGVLDVRTLDRLHYAGIVCVAPLWLTIATQMRGSPLRAHTGWVFATLLLPEACIYALLYTGDASAWFIGYDDAGARIRGTLWWVHAGYSWTLAALATLQLVRAGLEQRRRRRRAGRLALAAVSCAPLVGNVAYVTQGLPGIDATPALLALMLVALRSQLFSGDLLQALPLSQHDLLSQLPTPLVLTDLGDHVTEVNPAAEIELGVAKEDALDRHLSAVLEDAIARPDFERWSIVAAGREVGHILLVRRPKERAA